MKRVDFTSSTADAGLVWSHLQDERQEVCDAMLHGNSTSTETPKTQQSRLELMQSRLAQIDDALDRVSSGLSGYCNNCGKAIDQERLESDAAVSECAVCVKVESESDTIDGLAISTRQAFDVIHVHTSHSSYRFLLIDPLTGRSVVEGGKFFSEPTEATILGSSTRSAAFRSGWIGIGSRLELWADDQLISTSAVSSVQVERSIAEQVQSELSVLGC